jgi:RNA polymerase sigma-70 factor (ECF subfamily)
MPDVDGFDAFYRGTAQRLARYAYGLTGDATEAQDLTQEAYARAWQRWGRVRTYDEPEAWLRMVVTRLATDRWRRLVVRGAFSRMQPPAEPVPPPSENTVILVRALRTLPLVQRRALVLHYLLDRSVADIADETGTNVNTVKSWLSRGRAGLAAALGQGNETAHAHRGGIDGD